MSSLSLHCRQTCAATGQGDKLCAVMSAEDGRWRSRPCTEQYPSACRTEGGELVMGGGGSRGECSGGASFALPAHAKEGAALHRQLLRSEAPACWLPLQGALPGLLISCQSRQDTRNAGACMWEPSSHDQVPVARENVRVCHAFRGIPCMCSKARSLHEGGLSLLCLACEFVPVL